jgi:hypothetical protein
LAFRPRHAPVERETAHREAAGDVARCIGGDQRAVERAEREIAVGKREPSSVDAAETDRQAAAVRRHAPAIAPLHAEIERGDEIAYLAVAKRPGDVRGAAQIDAPAALWLNSDADAEFVGRDARIVRAPVRERKRAVGLERRGRRPIDVSSSKEAFGAPPPLSSIAMAPES